MPKKDNNISIVENNVKSEKQITTPNNKKANNIIISNDFNFYYNNGEKHALKNINIAMKENSITAFIGPSGCGKSTFLRSLNRMNDLMDGVKISGDIMINDESIYNQGFDVTKLRTEVGMVFQKPNPFPMSIYDNIAFGPKSLRIKDKNVINQIVQQSLEEAALWDDVKDILNKPASGLSGGQQQRLCIARAIAMRPKILLMDEPTSALDPIATLKIEELLLKLKKHYTIIIVTHSMAQATRISNYVAFFLQGELVEFGRTKKIFTNPSDKRTEDYISGRFG